MSFALIKTQAESHVSLASINIDFSLFRVQPPNEYQAIGNALSPQRREQADTGQTHATASKLGVLFDSLVPAVPHLIQAYGLRCGETAESPLFNPKGGKEHGLFEAQIGADGTSIWAAATSGNSAIAVHLLACLLARIWDSSKAISIWMELIAVRKQALAAAGNPISTHASCIELTREDVALWDASARSWCLTADQANERRQKQLRLIIDHLGLPVNPKPELSASVIDAWQTAMSMVNKLVAGEPQSAHSGAPLLGLASWHLYPDLIVFGKTRDSREVKQKDHLVHPGGILTLGIEDTRRLGQGIYWSLPLAHLRYYGDPVPCEVALHSSTSRVSVEQLMYVAFGSFIRRWLTDVDDIIPASILCLELCHGCGLWDDGSTRSSWLSLFAHLAKELLGSTGERRADLLGLIKCGRRRYPQFIDHPSAPSMFGFSVPTVFLGLLSDNLGCVALLREVAKDFISSSSQASNQFMVIQCRESSRSDWHLFSATPLKSTGKFLHWSKADSCTLSEASDSIHITLPEVLPGFTSTTPTRNTGQSAPADFYSWYLRHIVPDQQFAGARGASIRARFLCGDARRAALYSISITTWLLSPDIDPQTFTNQAMPDLPNVFFLRHITMAVKHRLLDMYSVKAHLAKMSVSKQCDDTASSRSLLIALKALLTIWTVYQNLPGATVELKAAKQPLSTHQWLSNDLLTQLAVPWGPFHLSREQTFACIAKYESGNFNIQPSAMKGVLAISSGNSIFVARCLLQDPCEHRSGSIIARVVGTVGKSGMAMLIPPQLPRVRSATNDYALVNHDAFEGVSEDCFQKTTLHMSFTEWKLAIDVGSRGNRDVEAYYVETAIGVYDHGRWVADVNIVDIFSHEMCSIMRNCHVVHDHPKTFQDLGKLVRIDNWDELIDSPPEVAVVRTRSNWQARLAAAALSLQLGHETRILSDKICWTCADLPPFEGIRPSRPSNEFNERCHEQMNGLLRKHKHDDDSDSDLDEIVEKRIEMSKRRKIYDDCDEEPQTQEATSTHQNLVYIL